MELKIRLFSSQTNKVILTSKCAMSRRFVKNCLKKLKVGDIVDCYQIDDDKCQFVVELSNNDGN